MQCSTDSCMSQSRSIMRFYRGSRSFIIRLALRRWGRYSVGGGRSYAADTTRRPSPKPQFIKVRQDVEVATTSLSRSSITDSALHTPHQNRHSCTKYGVEDEGRTLRLTSSNGESSSYSAVWLRHNCQCPSCLTSSRQKSIDPAILDPRTTVVPLDSSGGRLY